jgi:hypothetical protein
MLGRNIEREVRFDDLPPRPSALAKYSDDQARDDHGRWTRDGRTESATASLDMWRARGMDFKVGEGVTATDARGILAGRLELRAPSWEPGRNHIGVAWTTEELRNQGLATAMAEAFHEAKPDTTLVHGGFTSWEGYAWAKEMVATFPGWNALSRSSAPPSEQMAGPRPSWLAKARHSELLKFDPHQARDEAGRWTSGGAPQVPLSPITGGQYFSDLSPGAQAFVDSKLAKFGVDRGDLVTEVRGRMTPELLAQGAAWYQDARDLALGMGRVSLGAVTPEQAAAVIAVMSPQCPWEMNAETAARMADWYGQGNGEGMTPEEATAQFRADWTANGWAGVGTTGDNRGNGVLPDNMTKGFDLMMGPPPEPAEVLTTNKVRSFDNNILYLGQTTDVTVDIHMSKAFGFASSLDAESAISLMSKGSEQQARTYANGRVVEDTQVASVGYTALSSVVREVADGAGVAPAVVQAAYWLAVQNLQPAGWDPPRASWTIDTPFSDQLRTLGGA